MNTLIKARSKELLDGLLSFRKEIHYENPATQKGNILVINISKCKKNKWMCQYLGHTKTLELSFCKTPETLLKRLSWLQSGKHLEFAQDVNGQKRFQVILTDNSRIKNKKGQLALSL